MTSIVSAEISSDALDGFAAAVGAEHVLTDEASLREFRDPFAFETWDDYTASAIVMPETVEESPGDRARRQPAQDPALDALDRPQQRLRRPCAAACAARSSSACGG